MPYATQRQIEALATAAEAVGVTNLDDYARAKFPRLTETEGAADLKLHEIRLATDELHYVKVESREADYLKVLGLPGAG